MSAEAATSLFQRLEAQGQAILQLAADMKEMRAKMSVEPLPGQGIGGGWKEVIGNVAKAFAEGAASFRGGGDMEKRALETFFRLGETTMETQILTNRAMARRLGLELMQGTGHVVASG
jgi:hypothetical protein